MGRLLGVDFGTKRIGLALSDETRTLASPLGVVQGGEKALCREIEALCQSETIDAIVLGLPLNMDGSEGPKALETRALAARLGRRLQMPVELFDERLTTVQASDLLRDTRLSAAQRRARIDQVAAQVILQGYLDTQRREAEG